jgi:oxygen-independent coproporphyrinogen III oxidase
MPNMLERAVPRYTSYPTAPNFSAAVDADVYRAWLAGLPSDTSLSFYLHVPYCHDLCLYCGCNTKATRKQKPIENYAKRIAEEIAIVARQTGRRKVTQLHWGGGTPSILGADLLAFLIDELESRFDLTAVREHAIELDPRHLTPPMAKVLWDLGVNRASLGVQDFDSEVQRAVGRVQPFDMVKDAVATLREAGVDKINFDLMYGLPKQTVAGVRQTALLAHALKPQRIAVFGYAHVPWFRPQQRLIQTSDLPSAPERLAQAEAAHETLVDLGYQPIGLDHYAQPDDPLALAARSGRLHRNFQGYTVDDSDALIGLGASAISRLPQGFAQNAPAVGNYARAIAAGNLAVIKGVGISDDDRIRGEIIERLMCDMAVDLAAVAKEPQFEIGRNFSAALDSLRPLSDDGSVRIDGYRIQITEKGRPFARLVASAFDTYLMPSGAKHSPAV